MKVSKLFLRQGLICGILALCVVFANAQETDKTAQKQITVSGKVLDEKGNPLSGITVQLKDGKVVAVSDKDGTFKASVNADATLVFSAVDYTIHEVSVNNQSSMNVVMNINAKSLEDVVVIGYGTQRKRAVTGSVVSVGYEKFKDRSYSNVVQSLEGSVPGLTIIQTQGAPGFGPTIRVRGITSITAGTTPLYVVDGMAMENFDLNLINPQDIQSIDILKDAASSAIYGSRGANGVIIVTTKLGKSGKPAVNVTFEHGIQKVIRKVDMMDAQEWIRWYIDARNNAWIARGGNASDPNSVRIQSKTYLIPPDFLTNPGQFGKGTDWQDIMFRTAPSNSVQLSVSGGTDKTQYLFSGGYLDQDAVLIDNFYKRLSLRSNIRQKVSDAVTVGLNLAFTGAYDRTDGTTGKSDVISLGIQSDPIFPEYNENGNLGFLDPNSTWNRFSTYGVQLWHPYSLIKYADKLNKTFNTLANAYVEIKPMKDLTFRSSVNANLTNRRYNWYWYANQGYGYSSLLPAQGTVNTYYSYNWLTENTLSYDKTVGEHTIGALIGYTAQKNREENTAQNSSSFPNDLVQTLNAGQPTLSQSFASDWSVLSWLGRISYSFKNKYFLTANIRRDGSSRFGENSRWGYFPSASVGWIVSDEEFMKNADWVNNLKLRASYGITGNNQIPNYGAISLLSGVRYVNGEVVVNGQRVTTSPNPDLKWEKTGQFNAAVDASLFKNRINLTVEVYKSITRDLLLNVPVPVLTGFTSQLANIGKVQNKGLEISLNTRNIVNKDFRWSTDFNFSLNRNKVLKLGPNNAPVRVEDWGVFLTEVGKPISNYYGYIFDGVFMTAAQVNNTPHYPGTTAGDPLVRDVNGDKIINQNDRTYIGNAQPNFTAGLTNTINYKNFEFSFMLQGVFGNEILNQQSRFSKFWNDSRNSYAASNNYWRSEQEPGDGVTFKPNAEYKGLQTQFSSYWVEDGTFVRIKNIRLAYALPDKWMNKISVKSARIYINAENVYVFSNYLGFDPENSTYSTGTNASTSNGSTPGLQVGADYGGYPIPLMVTFGAKFNF
jgi:TonB-dependent starch-binding outer membrane protein SusC